MHAKKLLLLLTLSIAFVCHGQNIDISGVWQGGLGQKESNWQFTLTLNVQQNGSLLAGTAKIVSIDKGDALVIFKVAGKIDGNHFQLVDISLVQSSEYPWVWCKKKYTGTIYKLKDSLVIKGDWDSDAGANAVYINGTLKMDTKSWCFPGKFTASKQATQKDMAAIPYMPVPQSTLVNDATINYAAVAKRKAIILKEMEVVSDSLKLAFYDNGIIDNDSISVFFNKTQIISSQKLTANPLEVTIFINPDITNELVMYANNEGDIPPNTALLIFYDNEQRQEVHIRSDLRSSGTILLRKKK